MPEGQDGVAGGDEAVMGCESTWGRLVSGEAVWSDPGSLRRTRVRESQRAVRGVFSCQLRRLERFRELEREEVETRAKAGLAVSAMHDASHMAGEQPESRQRPNARPINLAEG